MDIQEARKVVGSVSPLEILGVSAEATREEINKAYSRLVRLHHPNLGGDPARMWSVQAAFEILKDQYRRTKIIRPSRMTKYRVTEVETTTRTFELWAESEEDARETVELGAENHQTSCEEHAEITGVENLDSVFTGK